MSGGRIGQVTGGIVGGIVGSIIPGFGTMLGIAIGSMVGGIAGNLLFPPEYEDMYGPRNRNLQLPGSAFGNPISITWGTDRHAGNLIWTSKVQEIPVETEASNKGGSSQTTINFQYRASYAVGIAAYAGENTKLLRIWSDNKLILDLTSDNKKLAKPPGLNYRFYIGSETQEADPTIESFEGAGNVPAHRGMIYIVYEDRDLTPYGGRYPSDNFEITTNGTTAYPYEEFDMTYSIWGTDGLQIDKTGTYLYVASVNHFYIMNMLTNQWVIENIVPTIGTLQYNVVTPAIADDGGWWITKQNPDDWPYTYAYFGKADKYLQTYSPVLASNGVAVEYPAPYGGVINCGITESGTEGTIWLWTSTGAYDIDGNALLPFHPYVASGARWIADFSIIPTSGQNFFHAISADGSFVAVGNTYPENADPEDDSARLYIGAESYDITTYLHRAKYVAYEPDNGWLYINGRGHDTDTGGGVGKTVIYDLSGNYVATVSTYGLDGSQSSFQTLNNHQLWLKGPGGTVYSQVNTLTGEVVRTIDCLNYLTIGDGNPAYDASSNALWFAYLGKLYKLLLDRAGSSKVTLSTIVEEISNEVSLTDAEIDVTELTDLVYGYTVNQRMSARRAIEPLQLAYFFDGVESDAKIKYLKRASRTSVITIPEADLSCHDFEAERPDEVAISRQFELEIPRQLDLEYIAPDTDYQQGKQTTTRLITLSKEQKTVTLPICFETDEAKQISEILHYLIWLERNRFRLTLSRKYAYLDNCDVITVVTTEATYLLRITKLEYGAQGLIFVDAVPHDADTFTSTSTGNDGEWVPGTELDYGGQTTYYFMDLPFFRDQDQYYHPEGFYVALSAETGGWHGASVYKSADGVNFAPSMTGINSAKQGVMLGALTDIANPGTWDTTSVVNVELFNSTDTLSSATELAVLNGANPCVIGNEICQFCDATLVTSEPKVYTLSKFLRGRRGTEKYIADHTAGERFVFVSATTIYRSLLDDSEIGLQRKYCIVTLGDKLNTALQFPYYGFGSGLKPLSPVHIEKTLNDANDYTISWIRRTRIGGSWRDLVDVPISESEEKYELDIYDENEYLLRSVIGLTSSSYIYLAADQTADGISAGDPILLSVYQISDIVGRGFKGGDGPEAYQIPTPTPVPGPTGTEINNSDNFTFGLGVGQTISYYYDFAGVSSRTDIMVYNDAPTGIFSYVVTRANGSQSTGSVMYGQRLTLTILSTDADGYYTITLTGVQPCPNGLLRLTVFAY